VAQASQNEQPIGCGRGLDRAVWHAKPANRRRSPPQAAPHECDRRRLTRELMPDGAAGGTDSPECDLRRPAAEQIRAGNYPPCAASVGGRIARMQLDKNFAQAVNPDAITRSAMNHTGRR
jgi:hypothetical protein